MTDDQRRVRDDSDELLQALADLKSLEREKRREPYSSPRFHQLAEAVTEQAQHVYRLATGEERDGQGVTHSELTVNDVRPTEDRSN